MTDSAETVLQKRLFAALAQHLGHESVYAAQTASAEALHNAFFHGKPPVCFRIRRGVSRVWLRIADAGTGFSSDGFPAAWPAPDVEHGRGLLLMRHYAGNLRFYRGGAAVLMGFAHE